MKAIAILVTLALLGSTLQLYGSGSKVIQLTASNFKDKVMNSPGIWLVEFYAPWCGHCKNLAPEWEKAAKALEGIVNIAAVDADAHKTIGQTYGIQGFPTIKLFGLNKNSPSDYNGGRDAKSIINFAIDQARSAANSRASGSSGSSGSSNFNQGSGSQGGSCSGGGAGPSQGSGSTCGGGAGSGSGSGSSGNANNGPSDVVTLTSSNFNTQVYGAKAVWLIEFYAPWCGHCKKLQPEWEAAAKKLKNTVLMGKVNCDEEQSLCQQFGVRGYPTIKYFTPGSTTPGQAQEYQGGRDENAIIKYGTDLFMQFGGDLELNQLTSQASFKKECLDSDKNACLIFFLPHILDSSPAQRSKILKDIKGVMKEFVSYPIGFMWTQGGDQFDFESQFPLGAGYPALLTVVPKKKKYSVMRTGQGFEPANIKSYINKLLAGSENNYDLPAVLAEFRKVDAWVDPAAKK